MVKNGYSNKHERISFVIEIATCRQHQGRTCKEPEAASKILESFYFTMYNIEEVIDFKNPQKLGDRPVRT